MTLSVGKDYRTRGGWKARVIFERTKYRSVFVGCDGIPTRGNQKDDPTYYVIHKPEELGETSPMIHIREGNIIGSASLICLGHELPTFGEGVFHPADIVGAWPTPETT